MPQGTEHQSNKTTKLLNLGNPGGGKTGALACLAKAGYRLIIVDYDNGLDILINLCRDDKEALERIYFETFTDKMQMVNGMILPVGTPRAFTDSLNALMKWKFPIKRGSKETYDFGNIGSWGQDTVVVIDSLGIAGEAALRFVKQINQHQMEKFTSQPDYGQAMDRIRGMLQLLYSDSVQCHVIVNTHITYLQDVMKGTLKGLPRSLGSKLPPDVGGYFNSIIHTTTEGQGKSERHVIKTAYDGETDLKLPILPGKVKDTLPIEDGLLTIFKALQTEDWTEEEEE